MNGALINLAKKAIFRKAMYGFLLVSTGVLVKKVLTSHVTALPEEDPQVENESPEENEYPKHQGS